jgi:hypothetical protein
VSDLADLDVRLRSLANSISQNRDFGNWLQFQSAQEAGTQLEDKVIEAQSRLAATLRRPCGYCRALVEVVERFGKVREGLQIDMSRITEFIQLQFRKEGWRSYCRCRRRSSDPD